MGKGIHPKEPIGLKYFNKKREAIVLRQWWQFCERIRRYNKRIGQKGHEKPVERRQEKKADDRVSGFSGGISAVVDEARWTRYWSWRRVIEWDRQKTYEQRYEQMAKEIKI